jgi:hypothetical protein
MITGIVMITTSSRPAFALDMETRRKTHPTLSATAA